MTYDIGRVESPAQHTPRRINGASLNGNSRKTSSTGTAGLVGDKTTCADSSKRFFVREGTLGTRVTSSQGSTPAQNQMLAMMPKETRYRLEPNLESVSLSLGEVVQESGCPGQYAYFPNDSVISISNVTQDGAQVELSTVGNEGVVGIAGLLGGGSTLSRAVVQKAGTAYRMPSRLLKTEFERDGGLQLLVLRYTQWVLTQVAQTAICNRHHSIEQQLCRWLLLSVDRASGGELFMTHEMLANSLGVRREGITAAAGTLRDLGAIRYQRGRITVLDREKLQQMSCECYDVLKRERHRLASFSVTEQSRYSASPDRSKVIRHTFGSEGSFRRG